MQKIGNKNTPAWVAVLLPTFRASSGGCSVFSGGLVLRDGWMQTTSRSQPGAPGLGLGGDMGGAQGGAQGGTQVGASGGGREAFSGDNGTSARSMTATDQTETRYSREADRNRDMGGEVQKQSSPFEVSVE